jgi:uncharacterized protein DUF2510
MDVPGASVAGGRDPGWYPDRMNPNVQKYWDGNGWTAQRRWVAGQWQPDLLQGAAAAATVPGRNPAPPSLQAPPPSPAGAPAVQGVPPGAPMPPRPDGGFSYTAGYAGGVAPFSPRAHLPAAPRTAVPGRTTTSVSGSHVGLLVCSILLILGSFTPWVTVSLGSFSASAAGTDSSISSLIGVNGWITFSGGILLFILVCMAVINPEPIFRSAALIISLIVAGFAVYDLVRIVQKISQSAHPAFNNAPISQLQVNASVGWGLIVAVIGGLGALVCAVGLGRSA